MKREFILAANKDMLSPYLTDTDFTVFDGIHNDLLPDEQVMRIPHDGMAAPEMLAFTHRNEILEQAVSWKQRELLDNVEHDPWLVSSNHPLSSIINFFARHIPHKTFKGDPDWWQIIPYLRVRNKEGKTLVYQRVKGGETRLDAMHSICVGGHIDLQDNGTDNYINPCHVLANGVCRELAEEIGYTEYSTKSYMPHIDWHGFIHQKSVPENLHLGLYGTLYVDAEDIQQKEDCVALVGWFSEEELEEYAATHKFEAWSKFVMGIGPGRYSAANVMKLAATLTEV